METTPPSPEQVASMIDPFFFKTCGRFMQALDEGDKETASAELDHAEMLFQCLETAYLDAMQEPLGTVRNQTIARALIHMQRKIKGI